MYLTGISGICLWKWHVRLNFSLSALLVPKMQDHFTILECVGAACACLQVFKKVQADPVTVRVCDEAQAHVGSGVMKVTNKIHCLRTPFGPQHGVQFSGPDHLVGSDVWYGTTERQRYNLVLAQLIRTFTMSFIASSSLLPYLRMAWVKQRFRSVSMYLRHCIMARGLDSTISTDIGPSTSSLSFCAFSSSLTKYTPDSSLPWVPPHTATRDNLGRLTTSSTSIWLQAGRGKSERKVYAAGLRNFPVLLYYHKHPVWADHMHSLGCIFSVNTPSASFFIQYASMSNDVKPNLISLLFHSVGGISFSSIDVNGYIVDNTATQSRDIDLENLTSLFWLAENCQGSSGFKS